MFTLSRSDIDNLSRQSRIATLSAGLSREWLKSLCLAMVLVMLIFSMLFTMYLVATHPYTPTIPESEKAAFHGNTFAALESGSTDIPGRVREHSWDGG